jgi:FkbM family methyltransferase
MSTYLESIFTSFINPSSVKTIFELGSRDLLDSHKLQKHYNAKIYAFECNPECLNECNKNWNLFPENVKLKLHLIPKAVSETNDIVSFYPFDLQKYNNMGASSMFKIDFTKRQKSCPDYGRPCPQNEIKVPGIRLDTFLESNNISTIDLLCMDVQGYELNILKGAENFIKNIKYIIMEEPKPFINEIYLPQDTHSKYVHAPSSQDIKSFMIDNNFSEIERIEENGIEDNVMYKRITNK